MKKIAKIFTAIALIGIMLNGCNSDDKLIEVENANQKINQKHFDAMISKIQSKLKNKDFKIYSIENAFKEPFKSKITERSMNVLLREKKENSLTSETSLAFSTSVLVINEKDKTEFFIIRIACEDEMCNNSKTVQWK